MDLNELGLTALRAVIIYVFVLIIMRIMGKRTVGNFTAFDLIVAFIISEVVDEPIFGDVPLIQGLVAIGVVAGLHLANDFLAYKSPAFDRLTGGSPRTLIKDGKIDHKALASERVNELELASMLREMQVEMEEVPDVKEAVLETNGMLSVIKKEAAKELEKRDLEIGKQDGRGKKGR